MNRRGRGISRGMLPLLAFQTLSEYYRLERKPPVTAGLLAANTLIYLRPSFLDPILPRINEVWFNAHLIVKYKDLKRFLLSPFYHIDDTHLVYNMLSLLWKGIQLETSMGSIEYASMVTSLLGMSQGITLLLSRALLLFDYERSYYYENAVGFSGVLFAMKVVLTAQSDDYSYIHGILVPTRHTAWAELVLIQMLVPGVSFLGHLGGILAGLLYLRLKNLNSGSGPLVRIVRGAFGLLFGLPYGYMKRLLGFSRSRTYGHGRPDSSTGSGGGRSSDVWSCPACTFDNSGQLTICEMCGTGRDGSDGLSSMDDISLEEVRRRRLQRFRR